MRKLVAAGAMALGIATLPMAAAHAGSTWLVGIKASTTTVVAGHKVVFTGTVRPKAAAKGEQVVLQERFKPGKPWVTQKKATVGRGGKYQVADKPTATTRHSYRVVMPATAKHAKGVSRTVKVTVYGWTYLADLDPANNQWMTSGTVDINGNSYQKSVFAYFDTNQYREYNLDHRCIKLRTRFGISDDSSTGGQAEVDAISDGTNIYTKTFDLGQSEQKTLALAEPLKLRLEAHSTGGTGTFGYGAFAAAQVLCTR